MMMAVEMSGKESGKKREMAMIRISGVTFAGHIYPTMDTHTMRSYHFSSNQSGTLEQTHR